MQKAQVYAQHNMARIGPKKVAVVMDLIRGKPLEQAKLILAFDPTKAAKMILKVVKSAEANAVNNLSLAKDELYVHEIRVNGARVYKTGHAGAKGRFDPILKRNSHIIVGLSTMKKEEKK